MNDDNKNEHKMTYERCYTCEHASSMYIDKGLLIKCNITKEYIVIDKCINVYINQITTKL